MRRVLALILALTCAGPVIAQTAPGPQPAAGQPAPGQGGPRQLGQPMTEAQREEAERRSWMGLVIFWSGAAVCMFLVARVVFKEQWTELKTQRALIHRIGPFFPEFDIDSIKTWVERAAPHLWRAWRTRDLSQMRDFLTDEYLAGAEARFAEDAEKGWVHHTEFGKVLKVHTLGLYSIGEQAPPADLELILRIETRGIHAVVDPADELVSGSVKERQVQHFWTLRHDGFRWRLHAVEVAEDDRTDLGKKPALPPIMEWKRPKTAEA